MTIEELYDRVLARRACEGQDGDLWFPEKWEDPSYALAVCATCPVRQDCLQLALALGPGAAYGIWGGTTATERRDLRRLPRRVGEEAA